MQDKTFLKTDIAHSVRWVAAAVFGASALSACVMAPVRPAYGGSGYYDQGMITADVAPPAPYVEPIPVLPYAGAVWIGGFWDWSGGRHVWRPGHYEHPRAGFAYRQPGWSHGADGRWMLHRGGWERR